MFSSTFCLLRQLCRQRAPGPTRKNFHLRTGLLTKSKVLRSSAFEDNSEQLYDREVRQTDVLEAHRLLKTYSEPKSVNWGEVLRKLTDRNVQNPKSTLITTCVKSGKVDFGMSYFKHVMENKEEYSTTEALLFCKLLSKCGKSFSEYEEVVKMFYEQIKVYMFSSSILKSYALEMFLRIPSCYRDCVVNLKGTSTTGNHAMVYRAFEMGEPEIGWHFIKDISFSSSNKFLKVYFSYCLSKALDGKFSVNLINDLVDVYAEKMWCLNTTNLEFELKPLIDALRFNKNDYTLVLDKCHISQSHVCSNCGLKLKDLPISSAEVETLEKTFFDLVLSSKDVSLYSSQEEVNEFKNFLDNCEPYNIVFDGLNLLFRGKAIGVRFYNQFLRYFLDRNWKVLVIGRKHSLTQLSRPSFLKQESYRKNFQVFLTSDASNDDLFVLYAALHRGPQTFVCSGDYLSPYSTYFPGNIQTLFRKWKVSHQYLMHTKLNLLPPWPHLGVPQLTDGPNENGEYIWHLPYILTQEPLSRVLNIKWGCLKAIPRQS